MNRVTPRLTVPLLTLGVALVLLGGATTGTAQDATPTPTTLVEAVRQATAPFSDPAAAEAAGYVQMNGCVSGPQDGAMGLHYINGELVGDGKLDAAQPEALIYALQDGAMKFVAVEYLVLAEDWEAKNQGPPLLMGHLFNLVGAPNRYGSPAFYELHVWAGQDNPHGMFADWNPTVSCADVPGA